MQTTRKSFKRKRPMVTEGRSSETEAVYSLHCNPSLLAFSFIALIFMCQIGLASETFKVTAYCPCFLCTGKTTSNPAYQITASGKKAKANHTAALNWLPFGSKLLINGKTYVVEDRGSQKYFGTKNNPIKHIDLFFNTHQEARAFGVRYLPVTMLKKEKLP